MAVEADSSIALATPAAPAIDWYTPAATTEDQLARIRVLGQRIGDRVLFICGVGDLLGASGEAKEKAVGLFYERLLLLDKQLGRIQDDLRLA